MTQVDVTVTINGRDYPMACAQGEEAKVRELGERIDGIATRLAATNGAVSESRLLVMVALILVDQMTELEARFKTAPAPPDAATGAAATGAAATGAVETGAAVTDADDAQLAEILEQLAGRIEKLAF